MKKIILIFFLFLPAFVCHGESFRLYIGLTQPITPAVSGEKNNILLMSVDILQKLGLDYRSAGLNTLELTRSGKKLSLHSYMEMPCIDIRELADVLNIDYYRQNSSVRIHNRIISVSAENGFVNIETAFAGTFEYFYRNNSLIVDLVGSSYTPNIPTANRDSDNIRNILIGQETLDAVRVMFPLKYTSGTTQKKRVQSTVLNIKLEKTAGNIISSVKEISAYSQGYDTYLIIKGGAGSKYEIKEDMYTGYTEILFSGIKFPKDLQKKIKTGIVDFQVMPNRIVCSAPSVCETETNTNLSDLIIKFSPAKGTGISVKNLRVCIDPGHGNNDPGTVYKKICEKDINFRAAQFLKEELESRGAKVFMTRDENGFLSLAERGQLAIDKECHIFISLHTNSCKGENRVSGLETYYRGNMLSAEYLGINVHSELTKIIPIPDKKLKKDTVLYKTGLGVLRKCNSGGVPGILIEMGFINHSEDRKYLLDDEYLKSISKAVSDGVEKYCTGKPINKM